MQPPQAGGMRILTPALLEEAVKATWGPAESLELPHAALSVSQRAEPSGLQGRELSSGP